MVLVIIGPVYSLPLNAHDPGLSTGYSSRNAAPTAPDPTVGALRITNIMVPDYRESHSTICIIYVKDTSK